MKNTWVAVGLCLSVIIAGCASERAEIKEDRLTVGKVQGEIKVGMSAAQVAELLGSPNIVTTDEIEDEIGAARGEADQVLAPLRAERSDDIIRVSLGKVRHHEAGIAARCAPGNDLGLEQHDRETFGGCVQGSRQAGKAAADDGKVGVDRL